MSDQKKSEKELLFFKNIGVFMKQTRLENKKNTILCCKTFKCNISTNTEI